MYTGYHFGTMMAEGMELRDGNKRCYLGGLEAYKAAAGFSLPSGWITLSFYTVRSLIANCWIKAPSRVGHLFNTKNVKRIHVLEHVIHTRDKGWGLGFGGLDCRSEL